MLIYIDEWMDMESIWMQYEINVDLNIDGWNRFMEVESTWMQYEMNAN